MLLKWAKVSSQHILQFCVSQPKHLNPESQLFNPFSVDGETPSPQVVNMIANKLAMSWALMMNVEDTFGILIFNIHRQACYCAHSFIYIELGWASIYFNQISS